VKLKRTLSMPTIPKNDGKKCSLPRFRPTLSKREIIHIIIGTLGGLLWGAEIIVSIPRITQTFWLDDVMHFMGGFWLAGLFYELGLLGKLYTWNIGMVALFSIAWEMYEFMIPQGNPFGQDLYTDTITDLTFDLIGATVAFLLMKVLLKSKVKIHKEHGDAEGS